MTCSAQGASPADMIATAAELTCASIEQAYVHLIRPHLSGERTTEMIVAGGGVRNRTLMNRLRLLFELHGVKVLLSDDVGVPAQAKEAVAFALLAWLSWHGLAGNVPAATGASHAVVLGKLTC